MQNKINKLSTNLWFDQEAEKAANYYISIFKNSKFGRITSMAEKDMRFQELLKEV